MLAGGARHLKKSRGLLREAEPVRFRFIAAEKASHSVTILCRCLQVTRSGFYAWQRRPESAHARRDRQLRVPCGRRTTPVGGPTAGRACGKILSRRASAISEKRVGRLMREEGLVARAASPVQGDDDERSRSAGRRQRARSAVHGGPTRINAGSATRRSSSSAAATKLFVAAILDLYLALRRRLGGERRQRPASHDQGASTKRVHSGGKMAF